jgi:hypothetical protein
MAGEDDDDDDLVLTKPPVGWQPHPKQLPPAGDFSPLGPVPPPVPKPKNPKNDPRFDLPPKPKLTRLDVPRYDVPTFPDPGAAGGGYGSTDDVPFQDKVLTRRDQLIMLAQNNIRWPEEDDLGSMQPYCRFPLRFDPGFPLRTDPA